MKHNFLYSSAMAHHIINKTSEVANGKQYIIGGSGNQFNPDIQYISFTDSRDNKTYKSAKIGTQTWTAENLNYEPSTGASACYKNKASYCTQYGRLYDWTTAKIICPSGWHLPSDAEWTTLIDYVGGANTAGTKLRAKIGWNGNGNGTDDYGFSALPGGSGDPAGNFFNVSNFEGWWSATEHSSNSAWDRNMDFSKSDVRSYSPDKSFLFSVRCVKD